MAVRRSRLRRTTRRGPILHLEPEHAGLVDERRAAVAALVGAATPAARRATTASVGYLLAHGAADVARHCQLLEPCPTPTEIRVAVTPAPGGWHVDVAGRDRPGLLAAVTGVITAHDLDIVQAVVATWDDGAALDAFIVGDGNPPDPVRLQHALEASLDRPVTGSRVPGATVDFDHRASPWYTRCVVWAADRPGLFHDLAVAIADEGVDVHAARAATVDGVAVDRFDLTDQAGNKLTAELEARIRARVQTS